MSNTVFVLGLDGLSWNYYNKLKENGVIPFLTNIIEQSVRFSLYAFPPVTYPSWINIMTGVNPGVHGIFGFLYMDEKGKLNVYTSRRLYHPRVHEMYGFMGKKALMINPLPPQPLYPIKNVFQLSTLFTPDKYYCSPKYLCEKYRGLINSLYKSLSRTGDISLGRAIDEGYRYVYNLINLIEEITKFELFDLYWITLPYPDNYLHKTSDPDVLIKKLIHGERKLFGLIDKLVKVLYPFSDYIVVVSDHGFSHYKYMINVNQILFNKGFLSLSKGDNEIREHYEVLAKHNKKKTLRIPRILLNPYVKRLFKWTRFLIKKAGFKISYPKPDPLLSKAYMPYRYSFGIHINDEEIADDIVDLLKECPYIKNVFKREELFWGPLINSALHLYIEPDFDNGYNVGYSEIKYEILTKRSHLDHHPLGVLAIYNKYSSPIDKRHINIENYMVGSTILLIGNLPISSKATIDNNYYKVLINSGLIDDKKKIQKVNVYEHKWLILKKIHRIGKGLV